MSATPRARALIESLALRLALIAGRLPRAPGPPRSLWTGTPIINMGVNARAERLLGVRARSLVFHRYHLSSRFDHDLTGWRRVPVLGKLLPFGVLVWAAWWYDRIHLYSDRGVLTPTEAFRFPEGELRLWEKLGRAVFVWTYGAEIRTTERTRSLGEPNCCTMCDAVGVACVCVESLGTSNFERVRRMSASVFSMGDMIEYTPGSRNDLFFWPVELDRDAGDRYRPVYPDPASDRPLRVVHAANHRQFKGTEHLIRACDRLNADGVRVELVLVENTPNDRALEVYRSADAIFDQCLVGFHGYFAQEAMALGKPVLCNIRKPDAYLLAPDECPIVRITPDTLEDALRGLANDRALAHELGVRGRAYIERHHTPEAFAARLERAYEDLGLSARFTRRGPRRR